MLSVYLAAALCLFAAASAEAALVAGYALDERAGTVTADVTGHFPGTLSAGATWVDGHTAAGVSLNGTTGVVTVANAPALSLGAVGTLEAWVKLTALNRWHGIIAKGTANSTSAHSYAMEVSNSNRLECGVGDAVEAGGAIPANVWTHLACAWDGTTLRMYVNGVLVKSVAQGAVPANTAPVTIGRYGGVVDWTAGVLDDVRLYNHALTAAQIQADMATPVLPGLPPTPLSWPNPTVTVQFTLEPGLVLSWIDNANNEDVLEVEGTISGQGGSFTPVATLPANAVTYRDLSVLSGQGRCYRVRAVNTAGPSAYSNTACAVAR